MMHNHVYNCLDSYACGMSGENYHIRIDYIVDIVLVFLEYVFL